MASRSLSYPMAEVVAVEVSPTTLLDSHRHVCEVCSKGFPRKQNLILHGRTHNLPFTLKTRTPNDPVPRRVYLCPEPTCIHHKHSHAIGDFGGLRKHYLRKHVREKKHKCGTCSKAYSVESDFKAHTRVCASRFSRGNLTAHQENCEVSHHVGAVTSTNYNNRSNILIGSTNSHPQTLGMRDNPIRFNRNQTSSKTLIAPQISSIQNQPKFYPFTKPYQSELCQFGANHSGLMTYPQISSNFTEVPPQFQATSSNLNLHGHQEDIDVAFYANLLMGKSSIENPSVESINMRGNFENVYTGESSKSLTDGGFMGYGSSAGSWYAEGGNKGYGAGYCGPYSGGMETFTSEHQQPSHRINVDDINVHGDYRNIYGYGEKAQPFLDDGCMTDPSNSLNLTPARHNHGRNGMLNPAITGSSNMGTYEQGGYMGYPVGNGQGYFGAI